MREGDLLSDKQTLINQTQLESYLWGAAMLLRGLIDAGDYKQFIFPLLFTACSPCARAGSVV
jgi:type I restriction-modification system DNA methylase subunit